MEAEEFDVPIGVDLGVVRDENLREARQPRSSYRECRP
jgi:hypothetical protein